MRPTIVPSRICTSVTLDLLLLFPCKTQSTLPDAISQDHGHVRMESCCPHVRSPFPNCGQKTYLQLSQQATRHPTRSPSKSRTLAGATTLIKSPTHSDRRSPCQRISPLPTSFAVACPRTLRMSHVVVLVYLTTFGCSSITLSRSTRTRTLSPCSVQNSRKPLRVFPEGFP